MGGVRTAGDLVARVQMTRRLRLPEAKRYVAEKLGCDVFDLSDPVAMLDLRRDLGLGGLSHQDVTTVEDAVALGAKFAIADVLDVPIPSVEQFARLAGGRLRRD
jgi:dimethylamine--corrinoid protein Co-methyltransferase